MDNLGDIQALVDMTNKMNEMINSLCEESPETAEMLLPIHNQAVIMIDIAARVSRIIKEQ